MSKAAGDATPGALQAPGVSGFPSFLQAAGTPNPAPGTTVPPLSHTGRALVRGSAGREGGVHCSGGRTSAPSGAAGQVSAGAGREGARAFPSPAHSGVQVSLSPAISWIPSSRPWGVALSLTLVHGDSQGLAWLGNGQSGRGDHSLWSQAEQRERPNDVSASSRCHHEMPRKGGAKNRQLFLIVPKATSPRSRCWQSSFFLACRRPPPCCVLMWPLLCAWRESSLVPFSSSH